MVQHLQMNVSLKWADLSADITGRLVCCGERPCGVRPAVERHSEGGKKILCSCETHLSRTSARIHYTCKSEIVLLADCLVSNIHCALIS